MATAGYTGSFVIIPLSRFAWPFAGISGQTVPPGRSFHAAQGLLQDCFDGIGLEWRELELLVEGVRDIEDMSQVLSLLARRCFTSPWDASRICSASSEISRGTPQGSSE